jgi:hypothetical protein
VGDASNLAASPVDILSADVDGDGNPEVFVLDQGQDALWMFAGNGTSELARPPPLLWEITPGRFVLEDATGDGVLDAVSHAARFEPADDPRQCRHGQCDCPDLRVAYRLTLGCSRSRSQRR